MCVLSDAEIKRSVSDGGISIEPFYEERVQPSSYDVLLGDTFRLFKTSDVKINPMIETPDTYMHKIKMDEYFVIHPKQFMLASTLEYVKIGNGYIARLEGKSSLGRLGVMVHSTAGYIDPGFNGNITLELFNLSDRAIKLFVGMPIGQLSFSTMKGEVDREYGHPSLNSKYQGQTGATPSKYMNNWSQDV